MRFVKIVLAAVVTATTAAGMMPAASAAPDPDRTLMRYYGHLALVRRHGG